MEVATGQLRTQILTSGLRLPLQFYDWAKICGQQGAASPASSVLHKLALLPIRGGLLSLSCGWVGPSNAPPRQAAGCVPCLIPRAGRPLSRGFRAFVPTVLSLLLGWVSAALLPPFFSAM
jgi:hypothetical protein